MLYLSSAFLFSTQSTLPIKQTPKAKWQIFIDGYVETENLSQGHRKLPKS